MSFFTKIYNEFISVNLKDYGMGLDLEINKLLFFLTIGLCAACVVINCFNSNMSLVIKKLIRANAFGEENAKNLSDLGLMDNKSVKRLLLKEEGISAKIIAVYGRKRITYDEYIELEKQKALTKKEKKKGSDKSDKKEDGALEEITAAAPEERYYIPEDRKEYAENWIAKNDTTPLKTLLYCICILVFYIVILFSMPSLLSLIEGIS